MQHPRGEGHAVHKRIVICCDGTWDQPNTRTPTNVVHFSRAILPSDPDGMSQVVFYDWGVGTDEGLWARFGGGIFGRGLDKNVEDAYRFLMHNYEDGDEIFLFGFSRGAFTVRSMAGLIRNCGLLRKPESEWFHEAMRIYRLDDDGPDTPVAVDFREKHSRAIVIRCLGVWDTVGALGTPLRIWNERNRKKYAFHDVALSHIIEHAYQALAVDERRGPFRRSVWSSAPKEGQIVAQVWFAGYHRDVGGGDPPFTASSIPMLWMKDRAMALGLAFDEDYLARVAHPDELGPLHPPRKSFYRLLHRHERTIGVAQPATEALHPAVLSRMDHAEEPYQPANVLAYIANPSHRIADSDDDDGTAQTGQAGQAAKEEES
jgi:uncharacterized protein (DUF2235 family)